MPAPSANHIVNFPVVIRESVNPKTWWDEEDSNIDLTYVTDLSAESPAVVEEHYPDAFRVDVGVSGAGKLVGQQVLLSEHDYLFPGTVISGSVWVYQDTEADVITFELYSDAGSGAFGSESGGSGGGTGTLRSVHTDRVGTWELLRISGVTIGASDDYVEFRLSSGSNSDKFYFTLPMLNIGSEAHPFQVNPIMEVQIPSTDVFAAFDPASATYNSWQSHDLSADVHPLVFAARFRDIFVWSGTGSGVLYMRGNHNATGEAVAETGCFGSGGQQRGEYLSFLARDKDFGWKVQDHTVCNWVGIRHTHHLRWTY